MRKADIWITFFFLDNSSALDSTLRFPWQQIPSWPDGSGVTVPRGIGRTLVVDATQQGRQRTQAKAKEKQKKHCLGFRTVGFQSALLLPALPTFA